MKVSQMPDTDLNGLISVVRHASPLFIPSSLCLLQLLLHGLLQADGLLLRVADRRLQLGNKLARWHTKQCLILTNDFWLVLTKNHHHQVLREWKTCCCRISASIHSSEKWLRETIRLRNTERVSHTHTKKADCIYFTGVKKTSRIWRRRFDMSWVSGNNHLEAPHFPESKVCFLWDETEKHEKKRQKRQEGKKNKFPFLGKSVVTLCWWTCSAHRDEKELPRLWNPPVKINILFKLPTEKGRVEMRGGEKKRREGWKVGEGRRKRHSWEGVGGAVGKTDNCLPCSNSGGPARLECAHCVGVWECGSQSGVRQPQTEGEMRGRLCSFCQWESHMKATNGTLLWGHHFWA